MRPWVSLPLVCFLTLLTGGLARGPPFTTLSPPAEAGCASLLWRGPCSGAGPPAPAACGLAEGTSAVRTPWGAGGALEREAGCDACCSSGFSISQRIFDLKKKSAFWHRSCCSRPSSKTSIPSAGSQRQGLGPGFFCLGGTIFTQVGPAEGAAVGETGPGGGAESDLATQGRPV